MKKFIIIGNMNAISYKEIFPYIKENKLWLGVNSNKTLKYELPEHYEKYDTIVDGKKYGKVPSCSWFTNVEHQITGKPVQLTKSYYDNPEYYPKYDNYDAINVDRIKDIPYDYDGVMGVPITFLDKYFNSEFEIIDGREIALNDKCRNKSTYLIKDADSAINGKPTYARVLIKKKDFEIIGLAADKRYENPLWIKGRETYLDEKHKKFVGMVLNGKPTYARVLIKKKLNFEIIGLDRYVEDNPHYGYRFTIKGKETYARVLIKKVS